MTDLDDKSVIESLARSDAMVDHDGETCGHCLTPIIWATVAREMLAAGNYNLMYWEAETRRRWEESKFFKLWQEETLAGRDPHLEFEKRGWEP